MNFCKSYCRASVGCRFVQGVKKTPPFVQKEGGQSALLACTGSIPCMTAVCAFTKQSTPREVCSFYPAKKWCIFPFAVRTFTILTLPYRILHKAQEFSA